MTPPPNHEPKNYSWDEIPPIRKHIYVYLLLLLATVVLDSFMPATGSKDRLAFNPAAPPRMTSKDVYPAPTPAPTPDLTPKPSDEAQ